MRILNKIVTSNAVFSLFTQVISMACGFYMIRFFINGMGAIEFGKIILVKTLVDLAGNICTTRSDFIVAKEYSKDSEEVLGNHVFLNLFFSGLTLIIFFPLNYFFGKEFQAIYVLFAFIPYIFLSKMDTLINGVVQAIRRINFLYWGLFLNSIVQIIIYVTLTKEFMLRHPSLTILIYFSLPLCVAIFCKLFLILKLTEVKSRFFKKIDFEKINWKNQQEFILANMTKAISQRVDTIFLGQMASPELLSIYYTLQRFAVPLNTLGGVLQTRYMGDFIRDFHVGDFSTARKRIKKYFRILSPLILLYLIFSVLITKIAFLNNILSIPYYPQISVAILIVVAQASVECLLWFFTPYTYFFVPEAPKKMNFMLLILTIPTVALLAFYPIGGNDLVSIAFGKSISYLTILGIGGFILKPYILK